MAYDPNKKHWTLQEFGADLKIKFPEEFEGIGETEVANTILEESPYYKDYITDLEVPEVEDPLFSYSLPQGDVDYTKDYDPGLLDHMHNTMYGYANLLSEVVTGGLGYGASALEAVEDSKRYVEEKLGLPFPINFTKLGMAEDAIKWASGMAGKKLDDGTSWDSTTAKFLHNMSAGLKKKSDEVFEDYIENSESLHGYLEWQRDKPYSWNNFITDPIDMTLRGISEMAPSIATMAGAVYLGAPAFFVGAVMEGSSEYNAAMEKLREKAEERGEEFDPSEASLTALASSTVYGLVSGWIEKFQFNRIRKAAGFGKKEFKKNVVRNLADKLDDSVKASVKKGGYKAAPVSLASKKAAAFGLRQADDIYAGVLEGVQEAMQSTSHEMISNIYDKYDGDYDEALSNAGKDLFYGSTPEQLEERWQSYWSGMLGGWGLGKFGAVGRRLRGRRIGSGSNKTGRYAKNKETDTKIKKDIGVETGGTSRGVPVTPAISEKGVKVKAFVDPDNMNDEEVSNYEMQAEREDGKTPGDLFVETVEDIIADPGMIDRGEAGDYSREEVLYAIENNDLNDESIINPERIEVLRSKIGEVIAAEGVTEVEKEPTKPVEVVKPKEKVVKKPEEEVVRPVEVVRPEKDVKPEEDLLQSKLDNINKKLQTKVTGKLKTKLTKQKAELEKALGVVPEVTKEKIEVKKPPLKKEVGQEVDVYDQTGKKVKATITAVGKIEKGELKFKIGEKEYLVGYEYDLQDPTSPDYKVESIKDAPSVSSLSDAQLQKAYDRNVTFAKERRKIGQPDMAFVRNANAIKFEQKRRAEAKKEVPVKEKKIEPLVPKGKVKVEAGKDDIGEKDSEKIFTEPVKVIGQQIEIDFQRPKKEGKKVIDNKEAADKISTRLKKKFPWIEARQLEEVFDEEGEEVAGRAFKAVIEWSKGKATLDTIPHEYGHLFIRIMKNHPVIKEGLRKFKKKGMSAKQAEENLVQHMGEFYANKMLDKGLYSRFKTWLRKFRNALKNFFGVAMTDKQVADLISEKFYGYKMKEKDLYTLLEYDTIDFQKLIRQSKFIKTLNRAFDSSFDIALLKIKDGLMDINTYIDVMETNLPERYRPVFRDWLRSRKETDHLGFNGIQEKLDKALKTSPLNHNQIQYNTVTASQESLQEFLDGEIALHEGEHDSRANGGEYAIAVLDLFGLDIYRKEAFQLFEAARNKDYQQWRDNNFIQLLNSKGKLGKELNKDEERRARRIYHVTSNQVESNRGEAHKLINPVKVMRKGSKEKPIFTLSYVKETEKIYKRNYGQGFDAEQQKYLTNWIAHAIPHLSAMSRGMSVLTGGKSSMYFVPNEGKSYGVSNVYEEGYGFLDAEDLTNLQNSKEALAGRVVLFSRGDTQKIFFGDITLLHKQQASNDITWRKFWIDVFNAGYITKEQGKTFMGIKDRVIREREIAKFSYTNALFPGYMHEAYEDVLKRIKIPLTPSYTSNEMPDMNAVYINKDNIKFKYKDEKIINGIEDIADVGKTYIGDGNSLTSKSLMKTISNIFGMNPNQGHHKSIIYDVGKVKNKDGSFKNISDVDLLMIKHQHSIPESGLEIYDGNTLIGAVNDAGDIIGKDGKVIDMIMTNDEAKKVSGQYDNNTFTIKGSSFGLIKMTTKKKYKIKFPHQWLNHLFNPEMLSLIKENYTGPNSKPYKLISNIIDSTQNPSNLTKLTKSLRDSYPDQISGALYSLVEKGLGFHPAARYGLEVLIGSKVFSPSFEMDNHPGIMLQMAPNYRKDLAKDEIAIGLSDAKAIIAKYKKATGKKSVDIDTLNDWLAKNDIRVLGYRSPIPYIGGTDYLRVKRVHDIDGTIQTNAETTFRQYEGDHDGDHMILHFIDEKLDPAFKKYFKSKEYQDMKRGLDLARFKSKEKADPANVQDRYNMIQAMFKGDTSVGEIAKAQGIYGLLKQSFEYMNVGGIRVELNTGEVDLSFMEKGYKDNVDHMLRTYIQAAVDNAKFLLLDKWNYSQEDLIQRLFVIKGGNLNGMTLNDLVNHKEKELRDHGNKMWTYINDTLWRKYKKVFDVRNMGDYKEGKWDLDKIIKEGEAVSDFMDNRSSQFNVETGFKKVNSILETLVSIPSKIYNYKILRDGKNHQISIMKHDHSSVFASHIKAVEKILPRLDEIKDKYKDLAPIFEAMQKRINDTILITGRLKGRKMMPMVWEHNETLANLRDSVAEYVSSFKTEERWEAFTIMYLDSVFNSDIKKTKYKSPAQLNMERLEKMLPLELLHSKTVDKYRDAFNGNLLRDVSQADIKETGNETHLKKGCEI